MRGNITKRGRNSWSLKFDGEREPQTGQRKTIYLTVRGTKADAQRELTRQLAGRDAGTLVEPSKITVAQWLDQWFADQHGVSPKTAERYGQLIDMQIRPHLGNVLLQKLKPAQVATWHGTLLAAGRRDGGALAPRTVGHAHRVLRKALGDAMRLELISRNVAAIIVPPKVEAHELQILTATEISGVLTKLRGSAIYPIAFLALATGMRRGELLALRWADIDLERGRVKVESSLEQTIAGGLRFKSPKTEHGRRTISLPSPAIDSMRIYRKEQLEIRVALGLGKLPGEALVFSRVDGGARSPRALTKDWARTVERLGLPKVSLHALRHSHASALIAAGLDVLSISRRLGHASPAITLNVYGHLFADTDDRAALALEAALGASSVPISPVNR